MNRLKALALLDECTGDDIWSADYCRQAGVAEIWIEELADAYESGFQFDRDTIYCQDRVVNQYHGVRDVDLAYKLAGYLGVETSRVTASALGRAAEVRALKEAIDE